MSNEEIFNPEVIDGLAAAIVDKLQQGVFSIPAETNDATELYRGHVYFYTVGVGNAPIRIMIKVEMNGDISLKLTYASGIDFWSATLHPIEERVWS